MKKTSLLLGIAVSLLTTNIIKSQTPSYVPTSGLVGWWPFNGNAIDQSGNGNNGTVNGATLTTDRFGNVNCAYNFNGSSNFISVADNNSLDLTNNYSISVWVYLPDYSKAPVSADVFGNYDYNRTILGKPRSAGWHSGYAIGSEPNDLTTQIYSVASGMGCCPAASAYVATVPPLNTWGQIVTTYDGATLKTYYNGVLSQSSTASYSLENSPEPLYFGKEFTDPPTWNNNDWYRWYKGKLDDIGIWNRALTQQEIQGIYATCPSTMIYQPVDQTASIGGSALFTGLSSDDNATYQWQTNVANMGWQNVPNNIYYQAGTSIDMAVTNVQLCNHLQKFRVVAHAYGCADTSNVASLIVADTCVNIVNDTNYVTINDTNFVTITDTNYVIVTDTNFITVTDTLYINAQLTGLTPPNNMSDIKIFPNPASDHITIDYGNYALLNNYTLKITNSLGQTVFTTGITMQQSYVDLSTWTGNGIYFVYVIDGQGNTIEVRKIVLQ